MSTALDSYPELSAKGLCVICNELVPKPKRGPMGKTCSPACRKKLSRRGKTCDIPPVLLVLLETCDTPLCAPSGGAYGAKNIVILREPDRMENPMFDWELSQRLADEYTRPVEWIKRGILACRGAGVTPQYFIDRYLLRIPLPMNKDVDQASRANLAETNTTLSKRGLTNGRC